MFAIRDGRARIQTVATGEMSDNEVEIRSGLRPGDTIVLHPSDQVLDGVRVSGRR
jgi:HlyD family secretion protein